ncbi:bifunctional methylenetetrahydrofolate dehydrogenase/methenyltetrahydrofolate cyclohydrolase [Clostridium tetani]|uniref:bifunctional methylenetetrahydrofolate dehydrogenase/methenyltetrahydrofolate cyclohydrolase n=1 Tax=Clostridium tetani TaxID=1513 RepID=UPI00100ADACE|nr:bifunctional methylenetetrahydrofolate dehydrogenase/methenyltetrahydrofolate cyclohydrolase [Clostridium tetani]RXM57181.1 bifunctional methylenetetrahydrofolate dehydrogenase/methenyltetrahydrofolate cyclohydrolase [Clostridium tetani]RXM78405.1 bifunctional methylenetetrahydrofolate dehydrogenase/methenyltetrahydrofolate cyclohydrolase [Clostridium tetani]RYU99995.1 bifunctional methylenetetrahydrofolate dehydrogenase/methenyltetrahydrofolate cyclohydrolase [Clostridium tetani]
MAVAIDGKRVSEELRKELKNFIDERVEKGLKVPCVSSILIGNDKGSLFYIKNQRRICKEIGIEFKNIVLEENIEEDKIIEVIEDLNKDENVHGIILQMPLPKTLDEEKIVNKICPSKDIDGLTDINAGRFYKGEKCFIPCTAQGIIEIIKSTKESISGKKAVVLGRSVIVGKPVAQLLVNEDATVTICHSKTKDIKSLCKEADIIVSAMGIPKFVKEDFIKDGAIVIDVGFSVLYGKMVGDIDYDNVFKKAGFITPVPGGVGSVTPTMLIKNLCEVFK